MVAMICTACGHTNDGADGVCSRCGGQLAAAPTGPSARCNQCGATNHGPSGPMACHYCGARVDIPFAAAAPPPRTYDDKPLRSDDVDVLELRESAASNSGNNVGAIIGVSVGLVFVAVVVAGAVESKHHKKAEKSKSSSTSSYTKGSTASTSPISVYAPARFQPIARKATVTKKQGDLPFAESTCDMRISPLPTSDCCRVWLTCGSTRVYGSASSYIQCTPAGGVPTSLVDPETTPDDGDAQLNVDLGKATATFADTNIAGTSYSASFKLEPTTDPPPPAAPAFDPVTFTANVTSKTGSPPFTGSSCTIKVTTLPNPDLCRVWVTCGGKRVYGSNSSTTRCEASAQGPALLNDWKPSSQDNDAELQADFLHGTAVLADTDKRGRPYVVTFKVTR